MKQFAIVLASTLLGVLGALLVYDYWVVQPREARIGLDLTQARADARAMAQSAKVDLEHVREQAGQITQEVDASVERSVAGAREALDGQAREIERRRLANDALARAAFYKTAIAESYMSNGAWPADAASIGFADRTAHAGGAVTAIDVARDGVVVVSLTDELAPGAKVRLIPSANGDSWMIKWRCEAEGFDEFKRLVPACR